MRPRSLLLATAAVAVALSAAPVAAQAAQTESISRSTYDAGVERTAASLRVAGATSGELGGYLDVTVTAADGSLPTGSSVCEPATVDAVLTVSPGETLSVTTSGDLCTSFSGESARTFNGYFGSKDLTYDGTAHRKVRVAGDGLIAFSDISWFGGQASFSAALRW